MSFVEKNDIVVEDDLSIQGYLIQLNYYIIGIGGILMFFIGIITNIFNLIVFSRRPMKTTTNKYLSALAICDIFVLIFSVLITSNSFIKGTIINFFSKMLKILTYLKTNIKLQADRLNKTTIYYSS